MRLVELAAPSSASVLITGETGSGKEIVARTIHRLSPRAERPFIAINCSAIPESLMESEIFGHERGAFTGAAERRLGCFELADGGTLLLDEIGEMPAPTQAKLLRVLEDGKIRRLGSKSETSVNVRVLAATNREPEQAVSKGDLRQDLFFRLNVFRIHIPPLRDHKDDIPALTQQLLADLAVKHGKARERRDRRRAGSFPEPFLAGKYPRAAKYSGARANRVRSRGNQSGASAAGFWARAGYGAGIATFRIAFPHRHDRGSGGARTDPTNTGGHE